MTEQEIRAFALAIAEIKNQGNFCNALNCDGSVIELTERKLSYLKAIERYIVDNNYRDVVYYHEEQAPIKNTSNFHFTLFHTDSFNFNTGFNTTFPLTCIT